MRRKRASSLGPTMGRIQSDLVETMIERELGIMARAGQLPKNAAEMVEAGMMEDRVPVGVDHTSPLNLLQRLTQSAAIMRAFQTLGLALPARQLDSRPADRQRNREDHHRNRGRPVARGP